MFDKKMFSEILFKIYKTYNNQRDFADATGVNRAYLSQYINQKLDNPPTPKILEKIASNSHNIVTYPQLMEVCGYIEGSKELQDYKEQIALEKKYDEFHSIYKKIGLSVDEELIVHNLITPILPKINSSLEITDNFINTILEDANYLNSSSLQKIKKAITLKLNFYKNLSSNPNHENANSTSCTFYMCPVYGQISAGEPNWAEQNIEGRLPIDPNLMNIINPEEYFFLRVNGESMNNIVKNGAFALIHKQDIVENGEIAVVLINGYDATLKKFTKQGDVIVLEPDSSDNSFKTQVYDKNTPIKILGKYVGKMEINK